MPETERTGTSFAGRAPAARIVLDACIWIRAHRNGELNALFDLGRWHVDWLLPWEEDFLNRTLAAELEAHLGPDLSRLLNDPGGPERIILTESDTDEILRIYARHPSRRSQRRHRHGILYTSANIGEAAGIYVALRENAWFATQEKGDALELAREILPQGHALHMRELFDRLHQMKIPLPPPLLRARKG